MYDKKSCSWIKKKMTWINIVCPSKYMLVVIMSHVHNCLGFRMVAENTPCHRRLCQRKKWKSKCYDFYLDSFQRRDETQLKKSHKTINKHYFSSHCFAVITSFFIALWVCSCHSNLSLLQFCVDLNSALLWLF